MPIDLDSYDDGTDVTVTPGTNRAKVLRFIYANEGRGFTPKEIAGRTDVRHRSVHTVLGRLLDEGLIGRNSDGYYHALDDHEVRQIARSLRLGGDSRDRPPEPSDDAQYPEGPDRPDPPPSSASRGPESTDDSATEPASQSPVGPAGSASLSPEEAFALLGDETRVDILQSLWEAFESGRGDNAVPYSELFARVDYDDSGNFSYHLERLTGPFVRKTDGGYELTQSGINVVRAVETGAVTADSALSPTRVDVDCPRCDGPVEIVYADELLIISCTACPGRSRWDGDPGHLFGAFVPPRGIEQHSVESLFRAAVTYSLHEISLFQKGVCPHCLGPVETIVDACADHRPGDDSYCPNCERVNLADTWLVCSTCKRSIPPPVAIVALDRPEVTAFYQDHGIEHRFATWETVARSFGVAEELLSEEPLRLGVTIPAGDDELGLVLDGELNVIDAQR